LFWGFETICLIPTKYNDSSFWVLISEKVKSIKQSEALNPQAK